MKLHITVVVVLSLMYGVRSQVATPCSNSVNRNAEITIVSYKDTSGRWVAQVDMEHEAGDLEADPWKIDVQHNTVGCPDSPRVKVTVKLIPPSIEPSYVKLSNVKPTTVEPTTVKPTTVKPTTVKPTTVKPGYEFRQGYGYYKLHTTKNTWFEAKSICESEGAHLAIINSEAESQILKEIFQRIQEPWAYVGFHDRYREGEYLTVFDEPLGSTGFLRWSDPIQPDNAGGSARNPGEDCGCIHRSNAGLNDIHCTARLPFFCESAL